MGRTHLLRETQDRARPGRVAERGDHRPALVALGVPESTVHHLIAALLHGGDDAVLPGLEACRLVRNTWFLRVDRTRWPPHPVSRGGIPLAPGGRNLLSAAS